MGMEGVKEDCPGPLRSFNKPSDKLQSEVPLRYADKRTTSAYLQTDSFSRLPPSPRPPGKWCPKLEGTEEDPIEWKTTTLSQLMISFNQTP